MAIRINNINLSLDDDEKVLNLHHVENEEALEVFKKFKEIGEQNLYSTAK